MDPKEHPILLAEPALQEREAREKTVELLFEKLQVPALFLARGAVLSSFANGRQTSLNVDMGYSGTVGNSTPKMFPTLAMFRDSSQTGEKCICPIVR